MATSFDKIAPKYGNQFQSWNQKCAVKFWQNCWRNKPTFFAPFKLHWCLCALHKMAKTMTPVFWPDCHSVGWRLENSRSILSTIFLFIFSRYGHFFSAARCSEVLPRFLHHYWPEWVTNGTQLSLSREWETLLSLYRTGMWSAKKNSLDKHSELKKFSLSKNKLERSCAANNVMLSRSA